LSFSPELSSGVGPPATAKEDTVRATSRIVNHSKPSSTKTSKKPEVCEDISLRRGGVVVRGSCFFYHNLRVGIVSQHHIDAMSDHLLLSPLSYCTSLLHNIIAQSLQLGYRSLSTSFALPYLIRFHDVM
jgi:hypothetical protein